MSDGAAPDFEFGIINYNGGSALAECVDSILALAGGSRRVLVFDNASSDASADALEGRVGEGVEVVRSSRNLGYAGAVNELLSRMTADVVVLCNMDLRFDPDWMEVVTRSLAEHPDADGIASLVLELTDPPVVNSAGIRFYPDLHPQNVGSGEVYREGRYPAGPTASAYGAVMCFRRRSLASLRFDDDYFLFFEETDFFLRFTLSGRVLWFEPDAVVRHHRSLSTGRYSLLKLYYGERNRLTTVFKLLPVAYWPSVLGHSLRRLATLRGAASRGSEDAAAVRRPGPLPIVLTILRAWLAAVASLPQTLQKRREFYRGVAATPDDALRLVQRTRLTTDQLSLR